jgi:hypothetical protein
MELWRVGQTEKFFVFQVIDHRESVVGFFCPEAGINNR